MAYSDNNDGKTNNQTFSSYEEELRSIRTMNRSENQRTVASSSQTARSTNGRVGESNRFASNDRSSSTVNRPTVTRSAIGGNGVNRKTNVNASSSNDGTLTNGAGNSRANNSNDSKKKPRRTMKKQVRRTFAGLFLASALVVAAIPVQETRANTQDSVEWVKVLNYRSNINEAGIWEEAPETGDPIEEWKSYVPKVPETGFPIYTTSTANNSVQYRFAFVPSEHGSGTYVAVILGANKSSIKDNTLTIDQYVDAYKKYSFNTSKTNYCAVSKDDSFLYYPAKTQRKSGTQGYYKVVNGEYTPISSTGNPYYDVLDNYIYITPTPGTKPSSSSVPSGPDEVWPDYKYVKETVKYNQNADEHTLEVQITQYISEAYEDIVGEETVTKYKWVENTEIENYMMEPSTVDGMAPCYDEYENTWKVLSDAELYYFNGAGEPDLSDLSKFVQAGSDSNKQRIHDVEVWYIGQQYVEETSEGGEWEIVGDVTEAHPEKGVFAGLTNVTSLKLPSTLQGVGDCAFYGCQIKNVRFDDSGYIRTIGNSAFANCISLEEVYIPLYSQIKIIGKAAFWNDYSLIKFTLPTSIYAIGDYAFQDCSGIQYFDFTSEGNPNYLNAIGYHAFENCKSLQSITFSEKFKQDSAGLPEGLHNQKRNHDGIEINEYYIPISTFAGCTNLKSITINNPNLDIGDGGYRDAYSSGFITDEVNHKDYGKCDICNWLAELDDTDGFYFEGNPNSNWAIYQTAKEHCASFKHLGEELYERVVECTEDIDPHHKNTFTVDVNGNIVDLKLDSECTEIVIPEKIGNFGIKNINASSFSGNCNLKKVYIPSSIEKIESRAFEGCHQLEAVIFTQPENANLIIEDGAFDTQNLPFGHKPACIKPSLDTTPFLSFVGSISYDSEPFRYAMDPNNNINVASQTAHTYIYYYSGWPTNLTVKYDYDTDKNTVIDYPRYEELNNLENKYIEVEGTKHYLPYITDENRDAASLAKSHYEAYIANPTQVERPTQAELDIVDSALNIVLSPGIEAIKEGIFSDYTKEGKVIEGTSVDGKDSKSNTDVRTITTYSVENIDPYTFAGCKKLEGFYQNPDGCISIGDYAFRNDSALNNVEFAATVNELGIRPFMGCDSLSYVGFNDGSNYSSVNGIIYGLTDGKNTHIVECLEGRGSKFGNALVGPDEFVDVVSISPEAFMDCDGIGQIDLSNSKLEKVSEKAFALTGSLGSVKLPEDYCKSIGKGAFWGSNVYYVEIPKSVTLIQPDAFANVTTTDQDPLNETITNTVTNQKQYIVFDGDKNEPLYVDQTSGHKTITAYCVDGSAMDTYAEDYYYINPEYYVPKIYHTVYFWDTYYSTTDPDLITTKQVLDGEDAVPPEFPVHEGETATAWTPNYQSIVRDTDVTTVYGSDVYEIKFICGYCGEVLDTQYVEYQKNASLPENKLHDHSAENVFFKQWVGTYLGVTSSGTVAARYVSPSDSDNHVVKFFADGKLVSTQNIPDGSAATPPMPPEKAGYKFVQWVPNSFSPINEDTVFVAEYEKNVPSPTPGPSGAPAPTGSASPSGSPSPSGSASPSKSPSASPSATPAASPAAKTYTVTVAGGSGSGNYAAGTIVPINAYDMGTGQVFDKWTTSTAGVGFASAESPSTYFVMPAANVAITATYRVGSSGPTEGNPVPQNDGSTPNGGNTGTSDNPSGTKVELNKGGFSNDGVAGATVSGSTDNFIVKVTDDQEAADRSLEALQKAFGDITNIKYLPMDISLYDSTGRTRIADTTGLSVNLTLPLPDDLAQYAGNCKIASTAGGNLENLNSRFTTVDGVPCINFTATHFSPYVIYVDTANLTESTIDYTPKTGDPIHPKWFLAIGLAAVSVILFFKKDKKVVKKA